MFDEEAIIKELIFKAIKSSGSGGQHVNKTASKVELSFNINDSQVLSEVQKERLKIKLEPRLTKTNWLILQCGESRSQHKNKSIIIQRFIDLLRFNLIEEKERVPTKIPKAVIRKRLKNKKRHSDKKLNRKPPQVD